MRNTLFFLLVLFCTVISAQTYKSQVWVADQGNGTYKNPILYADYSDPDVIRVGDDYYMTASSFNCVPGLPVLHSKDLVNWKLVNYALKDLNLEGIEPHNFFDTAQHGKGVWAPCIPSGEMDRGKNRYVYT
jgi:beta-xylosidase